jgi:hypothetical protein
LPAAIANITFGRGEAEISFLGSKSLNNAEINEMMAHHLLFGVIELAGQNR